jgi:hypothetical protein
MSPVPCAGALQRQVQVAGIAFAVADNLAKASARILILNPTTL